MQGKYPYCITLQLSSSYKFRKTKDCLNQHNDYNKISQNLEYKLTGLHLSKAFLSGLKYWGGCIFGKAYSVSIKVNQIRVKKV